jgi:hypothetical protein
VSKVHFWNRKRPWVTVAGSTGMLSTNGSESAHGEDNLGPIQPQRALLQIRRRASGDVFGCVSRRAVVQPQSFMIGILEVVVLAVDGKDRVVYSS